MSDNPTRGFQYLNGDYVYYQRLRTDNYYPRLANAVSFRQLKIIERSSNLEYIANFFERAADAELAKEIELINKKFGGSLSGNYANENFAHDLITAINECLGIKKIFERNLALIKESKGQKNVMTFAPEYFAKVWDKYSEQIFKEAADKFGTTNGIVLGDALATVVNKWLPELVREAVLNMFDAKVESGIKQKRQDYADAYKEMADAVRENARGTNEFIEAFIKNYRLDKFVEEMQKAAEDTEKFRNMKTSGFNIKAQIHQRGGVTMEHFRAMAFNFIGEGLVNVQGNETLKAKATVDGVATGETKQKADAMAVIDIPIDTINDWLQKNSFGTREKDTLAILKLQESLKQFSDGFITYVNSKNYSLNNNFEHGTVRKDGTIQLPGFSAGSMISIANFQAAADNLSVNYKDLIRVSLQLIPGAIGESQIDETKQALTRAIASALFDDFNAVGVNETDGAKSIHLMDLNGILTPVSFYFHLLSEAFRAGARESIDQLISVQIETPEEILYPDESDYTYGGSYTRWNTQSKDALNNIKIGYHFLAGFKNIISQFV